MPSLGICSYLSDRSLHLFYAHIFSHNTFYCLFMENKRNVHTKCNGNQFLIAYGIGSNSKNIVNNSKNIVNNIGNTHNMEHKSEPSKKSKIPKIFVVENVTKNIKSIVNNKHTTDRNVISSKQLRHEVCNNRPFASVLKTVMGVDEKETIAIGNIDKALESKDGVNITVLLQQSDIIFDNDDNLQ